MAGTLFVIATPIGNLEDLSFRALRTLKEVDVIAAEDTRRTAKLLAHYTVRKPMVSLREHNERRETPKLIARLSAGESIALVSDAGTPGISDPGQHLVRAAREADIRVTPIPGPSAVMAALSATGIAADRFIFLGFMPRSGSERSEWLHLIASSEMPVVFFEAPHRVRRTIAELRQLLVKRPIYIHREISKIHEEYIERPNIEINQSGEFVVIVGEPTATDMQAEIPDETVERAARIIGYLTKTESIELGDAEKSAAQALGYDVRVVRNAVKKARFRRRRQEEQLS
jgi:16S rRNA (cytidine1402-2'-O)-methyltransferase